MKYLCVRYVALVMEARAMCSTGAFAATAEDLHQDADQALHRLTSTTPFAADLSQKAKTVRSCGPSLCQRG